MGTYELLGISLIKGIGKKSLEFFVNYLRQEKLSPDLNFSSISEIFLELNKSNKKIKVPSKENFDKAIDKLKEVWEKSELNQVKIMSILDENFPNRLRNIPNPPIILHYKGNTQCYEKKSVAIIGTREPSEHAYWAGRRMSDFFVKSGFTIVSGLAKGCDTIGHLAAIENNGQTIAILAGGLHDIYPKENIQLAEKILETNGLLLSEYEWEKPTNKNYFIERDRLQSGLSEGIIVLETGIKGGTRHTVSAAIKQKRIIGCLFTHPLYNLKDSEKFQGNIDIIKKEGGIELYNKETISSFIDSLEKKYENEQPELSNFHNNQLKQDNLLFENSELNKNLNIGSQKLTQLSLYNEGSDI